MAHEPTSTVRARRLRERRSRGIAMVAIHTENISLQFLEICVLTQSGPGTNALLPLKSPTGSDLLLGRLYEFLTRRIHRCDADGIEIFPGFRIDAPVAVLVLAP